MKNINGFTVHNYKRYRLIRNGTTRYPWNVYRVPTSPKGEWEWVGYEVSQKVCVENVDKGVYDSREGRNQTTVVLKSQTKSDEE